MRTGTLQHLTARSALQLLRIGGFGLLVLLVFQDAHRSAMAQVPKEYQVEAVCLWRLAQFVDWPTNAFTNAESPLVIGVLGTNPFGDALEAVVRDETAHGRKIVVEYHNRVDQVKACHIVFISESETRRIRVILAALKGRSILTVSDIDDFTRSHGGMIRFLRVEQNKIGLAIDPDAAAAVGLVLDARLLRMAETPRKKK